MYKLLLTSVILILSTLSSCAFFVYNLFMVDVLQYKSSTLIENKDIDLTTFSDKVTTHKVEGNDLQVVNRGSRGQFYQNNDIKLWIEWFTYDNQKINHPPYKLLLQIKNINNSFYKAEIKNIKITSNLNNQYNLIGYNFLTDRKKDKNIDVLLKNNNRIFIKNDKYRYTLLFEPSLDFKFNKKEEITLVMDIILYKSNDIQKVIKFLDIFKPITMQTYSGP